MSKQSKKWIINVLVFILLIIGVFHITHYKKILMEDVHSIEMVVLPSSPHSKVITEKADIEKIVEMVNNTDKSYAGFITSKGWDMRILIKNNNGNIISDLLFNGHKMQQGRKIFKVDEELKSDFIEFYKNSHYEENMFSEQWNE